MAICHSSVQGNRQDNHKTHMAMIPLLACYREHHVHGRVWFDRPMDRLHRWNEKQLFADSLDPTENGQTVLVGFLQSSYPTPSHFATKGGIEVTIGHVNNSFQVASNFEPSMINILSPHSWNSSTDSTEYSRQAPKPSLFLFKLPLAKSDQTSQHMETAINYSEAPPKVAASCTAIFV